MPEGQIEKDGEDGATTQNVTGSEQHTVLEQRQGPKLNEISRKLSLILTAIEKLTETIKESQPPVGREHTTNNTSTLSDISNALTQISERLPSQEPSRPATISSTNTDIEDEATRIKTGMASLWSFKLQKRKEAYWNMVKNQGHRDKYQDWVEREKIVVPRFLQKKEFNFEHEDQKAVRARAALNDFKAEIELRDLRAQQHEERYKELDEEMEQRLNTKGRGQVVNVLIEMWKAETGYQESISNRRWRRSARWLEDYEIKFLEEYRGKNPFFKTSEDQTEESATGTREPNYVTWTVENSRNTMDSQNNLRRDKRHQDTPRPRRYKQKQQQPLNMRRQGDTERRTSQMRNNEPDYQQPSTSREQQDYHGKRQSGNSSKRPLQRGSSEQPIDIEQDYDNDYFLEQTSSTETLV